MAKRKPAYNDGDGPDSEGPGDIDTRDVFDKALEVAPPAARKKMKKQMKASGKRMAC